MISSRLPNNLVRQDANLLLNRRQSWSSRCSQYNYWLLKIACTSINLSLFKLITRNYSAMSFFLILRLHQTYSCVLKKKHTSHRTFFPEKKNSQTSFCFAAVSFMRLQITSPQHVDFVSFIHNNQPHKDPAFKLYPFLLRCHHSLQVNIVQTKYLQ